ncbi:MAG: LysM peptidoglycan-binding domain-containing protein [Planctomycetota bacterium]|nr:LysM peptidoglycan-binding domain-containing protein [Planctomycetota bacterium]
MRPVTKVILVLSLVALAVVVLYFASRKWGGATATKPPATAQKTETPAPGYNDPVATYQRWRDRISNPGDPTPSTGTRRPEGRDHLRSTSRDEGTVVAHRLDGPVAGADPPGPVLKPEGIVGEIVRGRLTPPTDAAGSYTVVQGDTLCGISLKHYGDARYVSEIVAANPGLDANRLRVGAHIALPDVTKKEEKAAGPSSASAPPAAPQTKVYVIQKNDTLISIARKVYGDSAKYPKIYEANKDILSSPNARLYVGQKLRLPEPR